VWRGIINGSLSMRSKIIWTFTLLCIALPSGAVRAQDDDVVEVTVEGEGISKERALKAALRAAIERGAGNEISSHSQVESFELVRDTIYARADGLVTEYKVLEEGAAAGGTFYCKIRAMVRRSAVAKAWGDVQNVLDQLGRPGIAIYIREEIDGQPQNSSILESQIEHYLHERGFIVYAGEQIRAIMEKEGADAGAEGNIAKVNAIAKDFGTQIFITGTANANAAGVRTLADQQVAMYNGDAMIKMYYTDTAKLLASESDSNWRGGSRGHFTHSPQAGKMALKTAGQDLVQRCCDTVMSTWATQITFGGELELEVEGVNMADAIKIKKKLSELDGVERVNGPSLTKGIAKFRILAKMTAEDMVEQLVTDEWLALMEITDAKLNRIQAKKPK
jgi:hypothetical protein